MSPVELSLVLAGRAVPCAGDRVRRYCGLAWSGGPPEVWAWRYYDQLAGDPAALGPLDLVACAALHPGLSRSDLTFFAEQGPLLERRLAALPDDVDLAHADDRLRAGVIAIAELAGPVGLSLLSKIAHRRRPRLVPIFEGAIVDWYRPVTGRRGVGVWPAVVEAVAADLAVPANRRTLEAISAEVTAATGTVLTALRAADIAVWLGAHR